MISASLPSTAAASSKYTRKKSTAALTMKIDAYQRFRRNVTVRPTRLRRFKDITHPAHGVNQLLWEVLVHLVAQPTDQHVHDIGLRIETVVPNVLEDHCFRDH